MDVSKIPNWRTHIRTAKQAGIGPTVTREIATLLDDPHDPRTGKKLPHKDLHNSEGLLLAYLKHGKDGVRAAQLHMLEDRVSERLHNRFAHLGEMGPVIEDMARVRLSKALGKAFHRKSNLVVRRR